MPGHWEGDLINRRETNRRSAPGGRKTWVTVSVALQNAMAEHTAQRFGLVLNRFDAPMRLSMAYNIGREMAHHQALPRATGIPVCFAHPHRP